MCCRDNVAFRARLLFKFEHSSVIRPPIDNSPAGWMLSVPRLLQTWPPKPLADELAHPRLPAIGTVRMVLLPGGFGQSRAPHVETIGDCVRPRPPRSMARR